MIEFKEGEIVVSLRDVLSIDGKQIRYKNTVDKVTIHGGYESKGYQWVIGFNERISHDSFFSCDVENFRLAIEGEKQLFLVTGEKYTFNKCLFNPGDIVKALRDVSTIQGEYSVNSGTLGVIIDTIEGKNPVFWFDNHPGVFSMNEEDFKKF